MYEDLPPRVTVRSVGIRARRVERGGRKIMPLPQGGFARNAGRAPVPLHRIIEQRGCDRTVLGRGCDVPRATGAERAGAPVAWLAWAPGAGYPLSRIGMTLSSQGAATDDGALRPSPAGAPWRQRQSPGVELAQGSAWCFCPPVSRPITECATRNFRSGRDASRSCGTAPGLSPQ